MEINMFQRKHQSMVINLCIILSQEVGLVNKFQAESSRDQILVWMMMPFLAKRNLSSLWDPNTFQRKLRSMVINHFIILSQDHGQANKFQEENSRDQTQVLMTK